MSEEATQTGYWKLHFSNGVFEAQMPTLILPEELEDFDEIMALISRQIHRWSKEKHPTPSTEPSK